MFRRLRRLPSPTLVISAIALILAVGGGTFALASSSDNKKDKKIANKQINAKVPGIAKTQANKQINKKAPGLSVKHAKTADSATNADHAATAGSAAPSGPAGGDLTGNYPDASIAAGAVGTSNLGLDQQIQGNSDLTVPAGTVGPTEYPLSGASWTQQAGEVDLLIGSADYTAPSSCTGPGVGNPWGEIDGSIGLTRVLPPIAGERNVSLAVAGSAAGVISAPSAPTERTFRASVFTNCQGAGEAIVVHSMRFDLIRLR